MASSLGVSSPGLFNPSGYYDRPLSRNSERYHPYPYLPYSACSGHHGHQYPHTYGGQLSPFRGPCIRPSDYSYLHSAMRHRGPASYFSNSSPLAGHSLLGYHQPRPPLRFGIGSTFDSPLHTRFSHWRPRSAGPRRRYASLQPCEDDGDDYYYDDLDEPLGGNTFAQHGPRYRKRGSFAHAPRPTYRSCSMPRYYTGYSDYYYGYDDIDDDEENEDYVFYPPHRHQRY